MDGLDRAIINALQGGFPISERPFADAASELGIDQTELIGRLSRLVDDGVLSRFGPLFNAERMGGAATLAAMSVPKADFDRVAAIVNARPEVAHNYERNHRLNMWFVLTTDCAEATAPVVQAIEAETGLSVLVMPKIAEYRLDLRLEA